MQVCYASSINLLSIFAGKRDPLVQGPFKCNFLQLHLEFEIGNNHLQNSFLLFFAFCITDNNG